MKVLVTYACHDRSWCVSCGTSGGAHATL